MIGMKQESRFLPMEIQLDMDPEIRPVVNELNETGYYMEESCAGHSGYITNIYGKKRKWENRGYIHMEEMPGAEDREEIIAILKKHGIVGIKSQVSSNKFPTFSFNPFGEKSNYDLRSKKL